MKQTCSHRNSVRSFDESNKNRNITDTESIKVQGGMLKKEIQWYSLRFWIPRRRFGIPGTGFQSLFLELRFWIPLVSVILDSLNCISDSKVQDSDFKRKIFPDSGIPISLHGAI